MTFHGAIGAIIALAVLAGCASKPDFIVLLPGEDGKSIGALTVKVEGSGSVLLDKPYASVKVGQSGTLETGTVSKDEIKELFADALAAKPAGTVYFNLYYTPGGTDLTARSEAVLQRLLKEVSSRQAAEVQVTGYATFAGEGEGGDRIALKRARIITAILTKRGTRRVVAAKLIKGGGKKKKTGGAGRVRVIVR